MSGEPWFDTYMRKIVVRPLSVLSSQLHAHILAADKRQVPVTICPALPLLLSCLEQPLSITTFQPPTDHERTAPNKEPSSPAPPFCSPDKQLAMYSIMFYLPMALWEEGPLFQGWTFNAVILAVLGSAGGLLVALTMKYTDAVLKTFAISGAIIVTAVAGHFFLASPLDIPIGVGAGCTVLSLLNYSDEGGPFPEEGGDGGGGGTGGGSAAAKAVAAVGGGGGAGNGAVANGGEDDEEASHSLITREGTPNSVAV